MLTGSTALFCMFVWSLVDNNPDAGPEIVNSSFVTDYLIKHGYLDFQTALNNSAMENALVKFQKHAGIPETGKLDVETMNMMNKPNCGVLDVIVDENILAEIKEPIRWPDRKIFYKISQYSSHLDSKMVDEVIEKAFQIWSEVADLRFVRRKNKKVHIDIKFVYGDHGDGKKFDGSRGSVAHAFSPPKGDTHFDDEEQWTLNSKGVNLLQTAVHELGHALGLGHAQDKQAVMYDLYDYRSNFTLHPSDIRNIQKLYGPPPIIPRPENSKTPYRDPVIHTEWFFHRYLQNDNPDICKLPKFDAVLGTAEGQIIGFKGRYFYKLLEDTYDTSYKPNDGLLISEYWIGLPGNLDAAVGLKNGSIYFFRGDSVWHFYKHRLSPGYPKFISSVFPGIPDDLDAAFVWSGNKQLYFIKDGKYWQYQLDSAYPIPYHYPCKIENIDGLPMMIDAVEEWNNHTYFFSGDEYFRLNDNLFKAEDRIQRIVSIRWLGCQKQRNSPIEYENPPHYQSYLENLDTNDPDYLIVPCDCTCRDKSLPLTSNEFLLTICFIYYLHINY